MCLRVILDREDDGRWFAEIPELPGVLVYGQTEDDAITERSEEHTSELQSPC